MHSIEQLCPEAVSFSYRSVDRLILNAYIPTLQTPGAMAVFFRQMRQQPTLSGLVFQQLTDRFVNQVTALAKRERIPVLRPTRRTRPGEVAQQALRAAERARRWGLVAIVVHQESARVVASYHTGGRDTNFRVKEDYRLVNHYYFYLRDRAYGEGFVRISSLPESASGCLVGRLGSLDLRANDHSLPEGRAARRRPAVRRASNDAGPGSSRVRRAHLQGLLQSRPPHPS